jgi:non-specific serine/threonine protein kinase
VFGIVKWMLGEYDSAAAMQRESIRLKVDFNDVIGITHCVEVIAWVSVAKGDAPTGVRLFGALDRVATESGLAVYGYLTRFHERSVNDAHGVLDEAAYARHFEEGRKLTLDEAIALAGGDGSGKTGAPTPIQRVAPLTRREWEVAQLLMEGLSNKEIAARLVIGQRTAEGHVENIMSKLGFNSRTQVALWTAQHQERQGS